MWEVKHFLNAEAQRKWIERNRFSFQIAELFVNNGYAVEYKKLVEPRLPR